MKPIFKNVLYSNLLCRHRVYRYKGVEQVSDNLVDEKAKNVERLKMVNADNGKVTLVDKDKFDDCFYPNVLCVGMEVWGLDEDSELIDLKVTEVKADDDCPDVKRWAVLSNGDTVMRVVQPGGDVLNRRNRVAYTTLNLRHFLTTRQRLRNRVSEHIKEIAERIDLLSLETSMEVSEKQLIRMVAEFDAMMTVSLNLMTREEYEKR